MKTALCLSGRWNEFCDQKWIDRTQQIIPHDKMFTGSWNGQNTVDTTVDYYFDDPENLYHPVFDTEAYPDNASVLRRDVFPKMIKEYEEEGKDHSQLKHAYASANWHKQLLIHNEMMKSIPEEYDMIIRTRFDVIVSDQIDWKGLIDDSYDRMIPIGFNCMNYYGNHDFNGMKSSINEETKYYINDALIIHPRDCWDTDLVDSLYKDKQLKSAEEGWYQILSEPFGFYHESYHGGCYLSERWEYVRDVDESLHN